VSPVTRPAEAAYWADGHGDPARLWRRDALRQQPARQPTSSNAAGIAKKIWQPTESADRFQAHAANVVEIIGHPVPEELHNRSRQEAAQHQSLGLAVAEQFRRAHRPHGWSGWCAPFLDGSKAINPSPAEHPNHAEEHHKRRLQSKPLVESYKQGRREDGPDHGSTVEYSDGEGSLLFRKPACHHFHGARIIGALTCSHPETQQTDGPYRAAERMQTGGKGLTQYGEGKTETRSQAVHQHSHGEFRHHHAEL
jgi:hypothetical protein